MNKDTRASRDNRRLQLLSQIGDLARINQQATHIFDDRLGEFLGVNRTDGGCLDVVSRLGRVSAGQLAIESGLTTGAVTAVIDRLERAGYVARVRDPIDRRKIWVEPTPHLKALVEIIFGVYDLIGPIMVRHFTDTQLDGILAFLRMGARINQELAAGLRENTTPGAEAETRVAQAKQFRRAIDAIAPRLGAELDQMLPPREEE
jgi:DNA-binding MarR family transcriptional regulator